MSEGRVIHEYVLSDEQLDALAERLSARVAKEAARQAVEIMYATVGKKAVAHMMKLIGFVILAAIIFLAGKNAIHPQ